jgi:hypothetical protein
MLREPTRITVTILRAGTSWLTLDTDRYETVYSLKELIADRSGVPASQQRLVYGGKILVNEMSLYYYGITDGSHVYYVPGPRPPPSRPRPSCILNKLWSLTHELPGADSRRFTEIVLLIREILEDPTVRARSKIDPRLRENLEKAEELITKAERPVSRRTQDFEARNQDVLLDQFDSTPEGFSMMRALVENSSESDDEEQPEPTRVKFVRRISERPLPNPWASKSGRVLCNAGMRVSVGSMTCEPRSSRRVTFENRAPSRGRYSEALEVLKAMGFKDEDVILQALREADGNIQRAAQLLQRRMN